MNGWSCDRVQDVLPDHVAGRLPRLDAEAVAGHVAACHNCAAEAALVARLLAGQPDVPAGMAPRIQEAVRQGRDRTAAAAPRRWRVAAAAAAVVFVAAGGWLWLGGGNGPAQVAGAWDPLPRDWPTGDGMMAGAPVLQDLSDEVIMALLEEMEP